MVFLQGFSGDLRPPSVARAKGARGWTRRVLLGPWFTTFSEEDYGRWLTLLTDELGGALDELDRSPDPVSDTRLDTHRVAVPQREFVLTEDSSRVTSAHRVTLGPIHLVGLSAEPVAHYAQYLADLPGEGTCVPVGCIDDVFGYAPTD